MTSPVSGFSLGSPVSESMTARRGFSVLSAKTPGTNLLEDDLSIAFTCCQFLHSDTLTAVRRLIIVRSTEEDSPEGFQCHRAKAVVGIQPGTVNGVAVVRAPLSHAVPESAGEVLPSRFRNEVYHTGLCITVFGVESPGDNFHLFKRTRADVHPKTSADGIVHRDTVYEILDLHGTAASYVERTSGIELRDARLQLKDSVHGVAGHGGNLLPLL